MSQTFVKLVQLYESNGYEVQSSLSPAHFPGFNLADIPFSYIYKDGVKMSRGGGLALAELVFLECLSAVVKPKNIFVIGNSFGWTTLGLGIMCPDARVVAIDMCPRLEEERGLETTYLLGQKLPADVVALKGKSPEDVATIVTENFTDEIDLILIDGGHTSEQQTKDFDACKSVAGANCVYVFHDVINFGMVDSFVAIAKANPQLVSSLLFRTPSGMGISYPNGMVENIAPIVAAFTETDSRVQALHQEGKEKLSGG